MNKRISDNRLAEIIELSSSLAGTKIGSLTANEFSQVAREFQQAREHIGKLKRYIASLEDDIVEYRHRARHAQTVRNGLWKRVEELERRDRDFMGSTNSVTPEDLKDLREGPYAICVFNEDNSCEVTPRYSLETLIERIAKLEVTVKRLTGELNRESKP